MRATHKRLIFILILLALAIGLPSSVSAAPGKPTPQPLDTAAIDAYIATAMRTVPIPGLSLAIVQDGQIVYLKGYGVAAPDGRPVTPQTPFHLGSVGKTFTALAIQQLANQGKLDLSAPVIRYLPEFKVANGAHLAAQITLQHLLDHASGFTTADGSSPAAYDPNRSLDEMVEWISTLELKNQPGKVTEYSNLNFVLLGAVVQRVTGQDYVEYVRQNVLEPLGMSHTYFSDEQALENGAATGYLILLGQPVPLQAIFPQGQIPAGFVYSTAEDMARYLQAYLLDGYLGSARIVVPNRPPADRAGDGYFGEYWQWFTGRGWGVRRGHEGGTQNFNSKLLFAPDVRSGVVVLMNTRPAAQAVNALSASTIANGVLDIVIDKKPLPLNDGGFHAFYRKFNLIAITLLLFAAIELLTSLLLWPRLLSKPGLGRRIAFYALFALDCLLALFCWLGIPLISHANWLDLFHSINELVLLVLALGLLTVGAAIVKGVLIIRELRMRRKTG